MALFPKANHMTNNTNANMSNKKVLITGGNGGIGKVTAIELAKMGAEVWIAGRDSQKTQDALAEISNLSGNSNVNHITVDLASLSSVRKLAEDYTQANNTLDVLINNAGVFPTRQKLTEDGFEYQIGVNHLSHFLLTGLLVPCLMKSQSARVLTVSSQMHKNGKIDFECFKGFGKYNAQRAYAQSKLANVLFSIKLSELLSAVPGSNITSNALHPGGVRTDITRDMPWILRKLLNLIFISVDEGAKTSIMLASDSELEGVTGRYFDQMQETRACPLAYDTVLQDQLWLASEDLTGFKYDI